MITADPNLDQRTDWQLETGANVNPVPSDSYIGVHLPDNTFRITNSSSQKWGGALLTNKRTVPIISGSTMEQVTYVGMDLEFYIDPNDFGWLYAHETDLKSCVQGAPDPTTKIPNVYNLSGQCNVNRGGMMQIDGIAGKTGWTDTGIIIMPTAGVWNRLQWRYKMDIANKLFSVLSINGNNIDPSQQNLPLQVTNWKPVAAVQLQNEVSQPGVLNIQYRHLFLLYSDQPIPLQYTITIPTSTVEMEMGWGADPNGGGAPFGANGLAGIINVDGDGDDALRQEAA